MQNFIKQELCTKKLVHSSFYTIGNCVLLYKKRSAKEALLAEKKLVVNDTARARKSSANGLFIFRKIID